MESNLEKFKKKFYNYPAVLDEMLEHIADKYYSEIEFIKAYKDSGMAEDWGEYEPNHGSVDDERIYNAMMHFLRMSIVVMGTKNLGEDFESLIESSK